MPCQPSGETRAGYWCLHYCHITVSVLGLSAEGLGDHHLSLLSKWPCSPASLLAPCSWGSPSTTPERRGGEGAGEKGRAQRPSGSMGSNSHDCTDRKGAKRAQGLPTAPSSRPVTGLGPGARLPFSWGCAFLRGRPEALPR